MKASSLFHHRAFMVERYAFRQVKGGEGPNDAILCVARADRCFWSGV
jgi:hypothetical protein